MTERSWPCACGESFETHRALTGHLGGHSRHGTRAGHYVLLDKLPEIDGEWREHPTHRGLELSRDGRARYNGRINTRKPNDRGYHYVQLNSRYGPIRRVPVLMLETWVGSRPGGHDCDHINGIRHDDRLENLRWLPIAENRGKKGEANNAAKLTENEVRAIFRAEAPVRALAATYGVSKSTISAIRTGKKWRHITEATEEGDDGSW